MDKQCEVCGFIKNPSLNTQILETKYWIVDIDSHNHAYLGRAYVTLKEHKPSLSDLTEDEWTDFHKIVRKLETAYKEAFGAEPLNWGCLMNHAFRTKPFNPHVHWHIFPRYAVAPKLNNIIFDDSLFGEFYNLSAERLVGDETVTHIATTLRKHLDN